MFIYCTHQEWPTFFKCTILPARPQVCLLPPSTTSHLSSLSPSSSPLFASSPSPTSSSPLPTSHLLSLSPSSLPPFGSSPSSTSSSPLPTSHLSSLSPSSSPPFGSSPSSTSSSPSQPSATFYSFIILAPLLFLILGLAVKRFFSCRPSADHTVRFTANSLRFSSPPEELPSPPPHQEQPQSQSQSPDDSPPSPPPPVPLKKKNYWLIYETRQNTTLYAVAEIFLTFMLLLFWRIAAMNTVLVIEGCVLYIYFS